MNDYISYDNNDEFKKILEDVFTDEFMQKYTNFVNFEAFRYSSAVITDWTAPRLVYSKLLLDGFVKESTKFESWDEMVTTAADMRFGEKKPMDQQCTPAENNE